MWLWHVILHTYILHTTTYQHPPPTRHWTVYEYSYWVLSKTAGLSRSTKLKVNRSAESVKPAEYHRRTGCAMFVHFLFWQRVAPSYHHWPSLASLHDNQDIQDIQGGCWLQFRRDPSQFHFLGEIPVTCLLTGVKYSNITDNDWTLSDDKYNKL